MSLILAKDLNARASATALPPRRLLVIFNPTAGRSSRLKPLLAALDELGAPAPVVQVTSRAGDAEAFAAEADPRRFDAVVAAGGDGTINEVANGLVGSPLPLAIVPLGTANVLAAELDLPRSIDAVARVAVFAPTRKIWPGEIRAEQEARARRFLLMAGIGFDADVVEHLNVVLKRHTGRLAYGASILGRLWHYRPTTYQARLDGVAIESASLIVSRARLYGGRFVLVPLARLDQPHLHAVIFERPGRLAACRYLMSTALGRLAKRDDVRLLSATRIDLEAPAGAPVQIDGDLCFRLPVRLEVARTPLALIA